MMSRYELDALVERGVALALGHSRYNPTDPMGKMFFNILGDQTPALAELTDAQREAAMARFVVLQPHLEWGVPLPRAAGEGGVALRTAKRWLARYRVSGLVGLARLRRTDLGRRKVPTEIV